MRNVRESKLCARGASPNVAESARHNTAVRRNSRGRGCRDNKEKEIQETARQRYAGTVEKITAAVRDVGGSAGFDIIFDASGNSLNLMPVVLFTHDIPDLTDEIISRLAAAKP